MSLISIAMTTYNGEKFLREQIDSILSQTHTDWELIICDDCSKDSTWQILQEYAQKDSRIKIYKNEQNLGFKKNFEKAIGLCTGDYIALSDQDDVWLENHLSLLIEKLGNYSIAVGNCRMIDSFGNDLNQKLNENEGLYYFQNGSQKFLYRFLLKSNCLQGASMLMHASFAKSCIPIPEKVLFHDAWFAACACMENGINYSFDVINKYRQHGNNVTFLSHNSDTRSLFQRLFSKFNVVLQGAKTDRFYYIEELKKRYGTSNDDFNEIAEIVSHIQKKKVSLKDIKSIWNNYYYITTQKNHKHFLKNLLIWLRWKNFND